MTSMLTRRAVASSALAAAFVPMHSAQAQSFAAFLDDMRATALVQGVRPATVDQAFTGLQSNPRVVALDRRQPEGRITFRTYRRRVVSDSRVRIGRQRLTRHGTLLEGVGATYGVPPQVIMALWGIESSFGEVTGDFSVVRSLATLAHDGRRRALFTRELVAALLVLDRTPLTAARMQGSWAGAMGQAQFMPSTYLNHAVDRDGDGWADIWRSQDDVFASMANYLASIGWREGWRWGRQVTRNGGFAGLPEGREAKRPLRFWADQGVRRRDGGPLPLAEVDAGLVVTDDGAGPAFLVYSNFDVLMEWNRSTYFALSVGLLSDSF